MNRRAWLHRSSAGLMGMVGARNIPALPVSPAAGDGPIVLPHPQSITFGTRQIPLTGSNIVADPDAGTDAADAAQMIGRELARRTGQKPGPTSPGSAAAFPLRIHGFEKSAAGKETEVEGGYRLTVTPHGAEISSRGVGFRYAAATFIQLLGYESMPELREVEIRDCMTGHSSWH